MKPEDYIYITISCKQYKAIYIAVPSNMEKNQTKDQLDEEPSSTLLDVHERVISHSYCSPQTKRRRFNIPFKSPLIQSKKENGNIALIPANDTQTLISETHTPRSETQTPRSDTHTPRSETQTPKSDTQTPRSDTQTPRNDGQTPASNMPTPDRKSLVSTPLASSSLRRRALSKNSKFKSPAMISLDSPKSRDIDKELADAKEELRRLQLVQYHRKHNDLNTLARLTQVWRTTGHEVIHQLHDAINTDPKPTVPELLESLRIPKEHIQCDCDI